VLGAGIVHGLCIAALLPMLITVPAPMKSEAGPARIDVEVKPKAEAAKPAAPAIVQPPVLVTGSLAAPAMSRAGAIAKMPREDLRAAEPIPATLASAGKADLILAAADPMISGAIPAAVEEIEVEGPPADRIKATDAETEKPATVARAEPASPPAAPVQRSASAPSPKARAAKPKARAPVRAVAPAPRRQAAASARPSAGVIVRRPVQTRVRSTAPNMGLGLFFPRPLPARQQAIRR
jgi:hypothetical protein